MVYLIHFDKKYKHAQHYIGFVENDLVKRMKLHRSGNGAKLLSALNAQGITYDVVRTWNDADRNFERSLKNRKKSSCLCPVCSANKNKAA
jgi:predicted GIY-YIG superfamily endonuclease